MHCGGRDNVQLREQGSHAHAGAPYLEFFRLHRPLIRCVALAARASSRPLLQSLHSSSLTACRVIRIHHMCGPACWRGIYRMKCLDIVANPAIEVADS
jgi:hypothetical protein